MVLERWHDFAIRTGCVGSGVAVNWCIGAALGSWRKRLAGDTAHVLGQPRGVLTALIGAFTFLRFELRARVLRLWLFRQEYLS